MFFQTLQDLLSRNIDHKSATNEQFAVDFLDFGMSEVRFPVTLEAQGLILESRGSIVRISGIVVIFGAFRPRKCIPILVQILTSFQFFAVLFFDLFSSACFFDFL